MVTKNDILAALPKLSQADLAELQAVIASLIKGRTGAVTNRAPVAAMLFDAISDALSVSTALHHVPVKLQLKFDAQMPQLLKFFDENFAGWDEHKIKQIYFLRLMMRLVRDNLKSFDLKPSHTTIINSLHRMPDIFDSGFPGYRSAGIARLVFGTDVSTPSTTKGAPKKRSRLKV